MFPCYTRAWQSVSNIFLQFVFEHILQSKFFSTWIITFLWGPAMETLSVVSVYRTNLKYDLQQRKIFLVHQAFDSASSQNANVNLAIYKVNNTVWTVNITDCMFNYRCSRVIVPKSTSRSSMCFAGWTANGMRADRCCDGIESLV